MTAPRGPGLIDELSADLEAVRRPLREGAAIAIWLAAAWCVAVALIWLTGPFRPGFAQQLALAPRFALESALGLVLGVAAIAAAFSLATPGGRSRGALWAIVALAVGWASLLAVGLFAPALTPSSVGMRAGCDVQTLLFSLVPLGAGFWALRRRAVLDRRLAGLCLGAAAGSVPALLMQWACMYDPAHALMAHLGPGVLVAIAGALLGPRLLPRL
ncbi:MAG: DUF1109 domain-containing protein [bacterium]|nr:DUF1109 domain-containing protein [bacterium]